MAAKEKHILWEVGCEGHTDAWVVAENWEQATVKAAEFWGESWGKVAAHCVMKKKVPGAPRNVCCKCGGIYYGKPPMCARCERTAQMEEAELKRRLTRAYQLGKVM